MNERPQRGWARFRIVGALVAATLLAACGGGDDAGNGDGGNGDGNGGGGEVTVVARDFEFDPTSLSVASGDTVTVTNEGSAPHTFTVQDGEVDVQVEAGQTADVTIDLEAGDYEYVCTLHPQMTGTLTVS